MCIYRDIVLYFALIKEISPSVCDCINIGHAAVSFHFGTDDIENFVGGVGFTIDGLINGNGAAASCCTLCRKRRHRHGAQQGNSQQSRHEFFERLFHRL